MSELNSSTVNAFIEAVKNGADEAASAFERAFGEKITITPSEGGALRLNSLQEKVAGKGLAMILHCEGKGIAVLIPSSTGLVPLWCANPDATQKSKLATFAQEWGMNLLPEDIFPDDFQCSLLNNISDSFLRGGIDLDAGYLELHIVKGMETDSPVPIYMVWALGSPSEFLNEAVAAEPEPLVAPPSFGAEPNFIGNGAPAFDPFAGQDFGHQAKKRKTLEDLPGYSRSTLKVRIPIAAVLVKARKPIKTILELGVGSVIQFDKSCDELMDVEVGQTVKIATAEAVKVGEKFGFRINAIVLPEERFRKVEVRREGEYRGNLNSPQIIGKAPVRSFDKR